MRAEVAAGIIAFAFLLNVPFICRHVYRTHFQKSPVEQEQGLLEKKIGLLEHRAVPAGQEEAPLEQELESLLKVTVNARGGKKVYFFDKKARANYGVIVDVCSQLYPEFEGYEEAAFLYRMDSSKDDIISESESLAVLNKLNAELSRVRRY